MIDITAKIYNDEEAAREHLEAILWANGRNCPHCGTVDNSTLLKGKSTRPGVYKCKDCRKPFSVTVGTVFERSHIALNKWVLASHLMGASKKGVSAHQLMRMLGLGSYKTAWFMAHRLREAMRPLGGVPPMGSDGGAVEVDETFIGRRKGVAKGQGVGHKMKVLALLDRDTGRVRSAVIEDLRPETIAPIVRANVSREARLMTDEAHRFKKLGREFADHQAVNHSKDEYVRYADPIITTNSVESYFSVFKRGMKGTYQHCGEHHLHRYLSEFDFRHSNRMALGIDDTARAQTMLEGVTGKRLTYRRIGGDTQTAA
jgi:transposase-like protein